MNKDISGLLEILRPLARAASAKSHHWIGGSDNEGLDYCRDCAEVRVAQLKVVNPDGEFFIDGGWEAHESDGCAHCEACGALLEYSLTNYGVRSEIDHYAKHMKRKGALPLDEAYHIVAVLEQVEWMDDKRQVLRATKIGQRAVALHQRCA